mgnify:FL=1|tara:strand:- start:734 stop:1222 length:489 start_codon:yes stop_codon:yes gene_type:complete
MINDAVSVFLDEIPICGSLMGLDFGTKTIGIAVSDTEQTIATGIKTIRRTKFQKDLLSLKLIIEHRQIKGLVLGLPKNMNGTEGPRCQSTRAFANNISNSIMIPITFWDERLSTVVAERSLIEANASRQRRTKVIDYVAASFILQGALDRLAVLRKGSIFGR